LSDATARIVDSRRSSKYPVVIPAKAGIHLEFASKITMDPGLRRDDEQKQGAAQKSLGPGYRLAIPG
jgi:hypothetical protein